MREERPFLEIPPAGPYDRAAYEEWLQRQKDKAEQEDSTELERVVVIEL